MGESGVVNGGGPEGTGRPCSPKGLGWAWCIESIQQMLAPTRGTWQILTERQSTWNSNAMSAIRGSQRFLGLKLGHQEAPFWQRYPEKACPAEGSLLWRFSLSLKWRTGSELALLDFWELPEGWEKPLLGWVAWVSEGAKSLQGVSTAFKYQFAVSNSSLSPVCGTQKWES